jgi:hypothetical protein
MAENVENLVLEHLKRFQPTLERIDRRLGELATRKTETQTAVLSLRRDQVIDAAISAHRRVQLDNVKDRLDHIERCLELQD